MINIVKFSMSHEYKQAWNFSARACLYIFESLENCMLLYKYKLPYHSLIFQKFGFNDPKKLKLDKLDGNNILLFHLDSYKNNTEDFRALLEHCLKNKINIYIPIFFREKKSEGVSNSEHIYEILGILQNYQTTTYNFTDKNFVVAEKIDESIRDIVKPLIRDIKMKKLFGQ